MANSTPAAQAASPKRSVVGLGISTVFSQYRRHNSRDTLLKAKGGGLRLYNRDTEFRLRP